MVTLISWSTSGGEQGRCDAKCYEAIGPECDCICGGRNHGAGQEKAIENTRELADDMLNEFTLNHTQSIRANVNQDILQLSLPGF